MRHTAILFSATKRIFALATGSSFTTSRGSNPSQKARISVVGENDIVPDENFLLQRHAFADESVAGNFAAAPDFRALLDFNERADLHIIADFTPVKIGETEDANVSSQLDIRRNPLERLVGLAHE